MSGTFPANEPVCTEGVGGAVELLVQARPRDIGGVRGAANAGRGVVHSERSGPDVRARGSRIHAIQSWVALPVGHELSEPHFEHHPAATIPRVVLPGVTLSVIAGTAYGERLPVRVLSPTLYVHARIDAGATFAVDDTHEERAIYIVDGAVGCEATSLDAGTLAVAAKSNKRSSRKLT